MYIYIIIIDIISCSKYENVDFTVLDTFKSNYIITKAIFNSQVRNFVISWAFYVAEWRSSDCVGGN